LAMLKTSPTHSPTFLSRISLSSMPSNLRKAIAIVLQYPSHALAITTPIVETSPSHLLLKQLLSLIHDHPAITTSGILEYWRDSSDLKELITLSAQPLLIAEKGLEQELHDAISKMVAEEKSHQVDALIAKAQKAPLTDEEKTILNQWLKSKK